MYALIYGNDDGTAFCPLSENELEEFLESPKDYAGIEEFLTHIPSDEPAYWGDKGLLIKFEIVVPKEKTKAWTI